MISDVLETKSDCVPVSLLRLIRADSVRKGKHSLIGLAAAAGSSSMIIRLVLVVVATSWSLRAPRSATPGPSLSRP